MLVCMINRRRLGIVLGINQTITWGTSFFLPAVIAKPVAVTLGASSVQVLGAFTWALLVTGVCSPRVGRWIDRHGGRGTIALSVAIVAAGQVLLAISPNLMCWYAAWTVMGVGMALGLYDPAFATVGVLLGKDAGPVITGITLFAGFASSIFWSLGTALIGSLGWRDLLLLYAALMIAVNLPMVLLLVPHKSPHEHVAAASALGHAQPRAGKLAIACLAGFFTLRWFITSGIAVNILLLLQGIGLTLGQAVFVAALIGPGQVVGRAIEWSIASRTGLLLRARVGALLFPLGAALLPIGGAIVPFVFAVLYGMSNGMLTINRGTLPLALFGPRGYATLLGWLAVPVLLAQATAPTLIAPVVATVPALHVLLMAGAGAAFAVLLLLPLKLPRPAA
jgi:MFS family permease